MIVNEYNDIFDAINEPKITTKEFNSLLLPSNYTQRDVILNVKKILKERGILGNELKKLNLYAEQKGITLSDKSTNYPTSNIFIGGAI